MNALNPKNMKKYLPIGTVVMVKSMIKPTMIVGCKAKDLNKDDNQEYDYMGVPFPEGLISPNVLGAFNHEEIELILSLGYVGAFYKEFNKYLNGEIKDYSLFEIIKKINKK